MIGVRIRSSWVAAASVAYVSFAALRASDGRGLAWLCLVGLPLALWAGFRACSEPLHGEDRIEKGARSATRVALTGAALLVAARSGPSGPGFVAVENLGAALASIAGLVALRRIAPTGGVFEAPPETRRLDAAAFASFFWTIAIALPASRSLLPDRTTPLAPALGDMFTVAASLGSLGITVVAILRTRALRRFELGANDRISAVLAIALTCLSTCLLASLVGVASPVRIFPVGAAATALALCWSATSKEATDVARATRTLVVLALLASPLALTAVYVTHSAPDRAPLMVVAACATAALAGLATPLVVRRLSPDLHAWVHAFDAATRAAMNPDPDIALEMAMGSLRQIVLSSRGRRSRSKIGAASASSPALYRMTVGDVLTVDRAGYVHSQKAETPLALIDLASFEPERVVRTEVLRAAQVRKPEVRPFLLWLEERGVAMAAVVYDDDGPIGLLTIPDGGRSSIIALEEVRALRRLSDRLGAVIGVASSLARSRQRELDARKELDRLTWDLARMGADLQRDEERLEALARRMERPARVASYSPAARAAVEQLERLAQNPRPITLLAAPGIDAAAWSALAHVASNRRGGPLVIVEGTQPAEHDLMRWRSNVSSPFHAAAGGTLVVLDAHALPRDVQAYVGRALPETLGFVVTLPATVDSLVARGALDEQLADRLGDCAVALPVLASRGEDLRALALDQTARLGMRLRQRPLGLDLRALALLAEHDWPGNDAELEAVLLRAALVTEGDVVSSADLDRIGFTPSSPRTSGHESPSKQPIPITKAKRSRRR